MEKSIFQHILRNGKIHIPTYFTQWKPTENLFLQTFFLPQYFNIQMGRLNNRGTGRLITYGKADRETGRQTERERDS